MFINIVRNKNIYALPVKATLRKIINFFLALSTKFC